MDVERRGEPYLVYRDEDAQQRIEPLGERTTLTIGRGRGTDVALEWDEKVSRVHAELSRVGSSWTVEDDGLSRNGTFVNEERIAGRRRLRDGDVIRVGHAGLRFCDPAAQRTGLTAADTAIVFAPPSEAQRRVLVALCRPMAADGPPATNPEIAAALHLSQDAVKTHLRALFDKFGVTDLPQNRKRAALARRALQSGVVSPHELT